MSFRHTYRYRRNHRAISTVDQPASAVEQAFAGFTMVTMLLVSAYMVLM